MESRVKISNRKWQESSALFTGKKCAQNSLFWLLPLLIFCGLYLKRIRTESKKVYAAISLIPLCNIGWVQQLLTDWAPAQEEGENKVENKISKQKNKWTEVTEQGFVRLRGLGAKSRTKSYFKHSRDLFNSRPIKKKKTRYRQTSTYHTDSPKPQGRKERTDAEVHLDHDPKVKICHV